MDTPPSPDQQLSTGNITMALRIGKKIKHKVSLDYSSFIFDDFQKEDIKITESNIHQNLMSQDNDQNSVFIGKYLRPSAYQTCLENVLSSALEACDRYGAEKYRLIHFTYTSNLAVLNNGGQHKLQLQACLNVLKKNRFNNISDIDFNCLTGNESLEIMEIFAGLSKDKCKGIYLHFSNQNNGIPQCDDPEKMIAMLCPIKEILSAEDALDLLERELPNEENETDAETKQQREEELLEAKKAERAEQQKYLEAQRAAQEVEHLEQEKLAAALKAEKTASPILPETAKPAPKKDTSWGAYFQQNPLKTAAFSFALAAISTALLHHLDKLPPSVNDFFSSLWSNLRGMPSLSGLWSENSKLPETIST
jgi:hypothetical protein